MNPDDIILRNTSQEFEYVKLSSVINQCCLSTSVNNDK